jgi:GNAT superfamily N-acetyltransferase
VRPNWAPHLTAAPGATPGRPGGHPLPGEVLLASGTPAMIWPLLPTDARALREGFRRLSADSRRSRFLTALADLDDAMIRRLVDGVDGVHHIALVLTVFPPDGHEEPAGVARLVQDPADPATADMAVTVTDDWQGRGVGRALVSALMQRRPAAVRRLHTAVEAGNHASLALLAEAGHVSLGSAKLGVLDVTVELTAA